MSDENVGEGIETKYNSSSWGLGSTLTQREFEMLIRRYGLSEGVGTRQPKGNKTARVPGKGYVVVFENNFLYCGCYER